MKKKAVILGAGISGLATAYWLAKEGIDCTVLEKADDVGGTMDSVFYESHLFDRGPNSGLETTPLIRTLAEETGIANQLIYANEHSNKRYILRDQQLYALPMNLVSFLKTGLFSPFAKMRLLAEPFIGKSENGFKQSIAEFVRHRLGSEFLDYAINPLVAGVFAGDPEKLSVKSAFPRLYRLEEEYGGLIKGMIKGAKERKKNPETSKQSAKMFSFKNGMQILPKAIAEKLSGTILLNANAQSVERKSDRLSVIFFHENESKQLDTDVVVSTIPAYSASGIFQKLDISLSKRLNSIYYPPVIVMYCGYRREAVGRDLDGFGFLIPEKERKHYLGAIWSSTLFPNRADKHHVSFTLFIGGARSPELCDLDNGELSRKVFEEFHEIMKISESPVYINQKKWEKAIPQYELGHNEHDIYFQKCENNTPGIFLGGNYRGGISVGDCIKNSVLLADRVKEFLKDTN